MNENKFNIGDTVKLKNGYDRGVILDVAYDPTSYKVDFPIGQIWCYKDSLELVKPKELSIDEQIEELENKLKKLKAKKEKTKWQFTDDEKVILRNIDKRYNYICRDENGALQLFEKKPCRDEEHYEWSPVGLNPWTYMNAFNWNKKLFKQIKWEKEPCEFRKYIGE